MPLIAGIVAALIAVSVCTWIRHKSFEQFSTRPCAGRDWRRAFPDASITEIREFLLLFVDAFLVRKKHRLKFRPTDAIMDIYSAVCPRQLTMADELQVESFAIDLESRYGLKLDSIWRDDITLGEVFAQARCQ